MNEYEMDEFEMNNGLEHSTFQTFLFCSRNMNMYIHFMPLLDVERHKLLKSIPE